MLKHSLKHENSLKSEMFLKYVVIFSRAGLRKIKLERAKKTQTKKQNLSRFIS